MSRGGMRVGVGGVSHSTEKLSQRDTEQQIPPWCTCLQHHIHPAGDKQSLDTCPPHYTEATKINKESQSFKNTHHVCYLFTTTNSLLNYFLDGRTKKKPKLHKLK